MLSQFEILRGIWCCIPSPERAALRATSLAVVLAGGEPLPIIVYESFWVLIKSRAERQAVFEQVFFLKREEILVDGEMVPVIGPTDFGFWIGVSLYTLTPGAACLAGCERFQPL
mgnify:CR=1 FL=1